MARGAGWQTPRVWAILGSLVVIAAGLLDRPVVRAQSQPQVTPGTNVNMVSGTSFPDGDPFLQRQNEPSLAVSTRNPLHLLAGANDYRTVDLPGPLDPLRGEKMNADAWVGLFKSVDGGRTWTSSLVPGYPQDTSPEGLASPIKGRQAGTDPVVRAGSNGLFYYTGLAFDRGTNAPSTIFVARYMDRNDREDGDPFAYLGTTVVDSDPGTRFLDKNALAVDIPRTSATCSFDVPLGDGTTTSQVVPAGAVYVAYSAFTGSGSEERSQILFSRSLDCGTTWSVPKNLSTGHILNQNAQIAISPSTGAIYVSWRRFRSGTQGPGILVVRSLDGGGTFSKPVFVAPISPFDQGTTDTSFRTNGFQTMTVDDTGRIYIAWPERGFATLRPDRTTGDARIVVTTSTTGSTWSPRQPIETGGLGHQIMPALTYHGGKLRLLYYALHEDVSQIFGPYVDELPILTSPDPKPPRHTIDVYVAQAAPGAAPQFTSTRLSDYAFGTIDGSDLPQQLQYNPPNLPLFRQGTVPFMGDYIDLAPAPAFVQAADGSWVYNTAPSSSPVSHGAWADNRDVRAPADGDWTNYTPVVSDSLGPVSLFDPTQPVPPCTVGQTGMRNQNIYTSKVTEGLFVSSPGNVKPLGDFQRAFVVLVENTSADRIRTFRLVIPEQPAGGEASFLQFTDAGLVTQIDASVPPLSTVARTVYVTAAQETERVRVDVVEITAPGGGVLPDGLSGSVVLNGDATNPRIQNPRIQNPRIQNPDILAAEAYNPAFTTALVAPSILSPRIQNPVIQDPSLVDSSVQIPRIQNDSVANPDIINVSAQAPRIQNISLQDASIQNPRIQNELVAGAIQDTTWVVTNDGNTTAAYSVKLVLNGSVPEGIETQLVLHKTYMTPSAQDCTLALQPRTVVVASIPNPDFTDPADLANPRIQNPRIQNATLSLAPGESANVTLRVVDPNRYDGVEFDAGAAVTPAAVAQAVNTEDVAQGITTPRIAIPLTITNASLGNGSPGTFYSVPLQTFGASGGTTWMVAEGALPAGLTLDPLTGTISGTPTAPGNYVFTVQSVDADGNIDTQTLAIKIDPAVPGGFDRVWNGADSDWSNPDNWSPSGVPTATDAVYISAAIPVMPALTSNVTVGDLVLEPGATLATNGFTLTITGNVDAGNTITGTGTVVLTGTGVFAQGTFPNLSIPDSGAVSVVGPLTATGSLTMALGAVLDLNGVSARVAGQLIASGALIVGDGGSLSVGGVDVNGLTLDRVLLTINGGTFTRFDNVRFLNYLPEDVQLTLNHPGGAAPLAMTGLYYFVIPTSGRYIQAVDTLADGQNLVLNVSASLPGDGSSRSSTAGGAVVNWLVDPASASVGVTVSASPSPAVAGSPLTYLITVVNGGPATATNVTLADTLPAGATLISAVSSQGSCDPASGTVTCALGTMPAATAATVQIVIQLPPGSSVVNAVTVTAAESDPAAADNALTVFMPVVSASAAADLSIVKSDSTDPIAPATPFTYTLTVSNGGPATATGVVVSDALPAGVTPSSAVNTRGSCSIAGTLVTCGVGTLPAAEQATITITAMASASGVVTNTASVSGAQVDPDPANNTATETTMVSVGGCGVPSFSGPQLLATSIGVGGIRTGDFNNDGAVDIAAALEDVDDGLMFLGNGAGGFSAPLPFLFPAGTSDAGGISDAVVQDVTGDGNVDLVFDGVSTASVMPGNGAGGFGTPLTISFAPDLVSHVRTGDFDNDGDADLVVATLTAATTTGQLRVLLNDGAGSFTPAGSVSLPIPPNDDKPMRLAVADLNDDGRADVTVSYQGDDAGPAVADFVTAMLGDGSGGLGAPFTTQLAQNARSVDLQGTGDFDGDGRIDLLAPMFDGSVIRVLVLLGDGLGGFTPRIAATPSPDFSGAAAGDVNGDGPLDLVTTAGNTIAVQLGDGDATFAPPLLLASPYAVGPVLADFTNDGRLDIAAGGEPGNPELGGHVAVFRNTCGGAPIDLTVSIAESADPSPEEDPVTYTVVVTNAGATTVPGVTTTAVLSGGATVSSVSDGGASCTTTALVTSCTVASLPPSGTVTLQLAYAPLRAQTLQFSVGVTGEGAESNPSDNTAVETTTVTASGQDLVVTNTSDSGEGSLRRAIALSNADAGDVDRILFDIPGAGPHVIVPLTALPAINQSVEIDGTSQPGYAGTPLIELNGAGLFSNGLGITAGGSTVRGLAINSFGSSGIVLNTNGGNVVEACVIGTDPGGTIDKGNGSAGILILSGSNRIGSTTAGMGNLVSGNGGTGILMSGASATGNVVIGNRVGTNAAGTAALPNSNAGVQVIGGSGNTIGGPTPAHRNLISGGAINGVSLRSGATNNVVQGNYVGTNLAGDAALPNGNTGVLIGESSNNTVADNLISGNLQNGVLVFIQSAPNVATGNVIKGNRIGTNASGTGAVPNATGVGLSSGASNNVIGGLTATDRNVISGNSASGIAINQTATAGNQILGNYIGLDATGTAALANAANGVIIGNGAGNIIGGTLAGARNVISGNAASGVAVFNTSSQGNLIQGNFIGTDASGTVAVPNQGLQSGIFIFDAPGNTIGGSVAGAGNLVSGNAQHAVTIVGANATGNVIQGNFIGTDVTGSTALPNGGIGLDIVSAPGNTIGGAGSARNVISGNGLGMQLRTGANNNVVQGNLIGVRADGAAAVPNGLGILITDNANGNTIGGTSAQSRNIISGNAGDGIFISEGSTANIVAGNHLGVDATGTVAVPNQIRGVGISNASGNTVGGITAGAGNLIGFNADSGVSVSSGTGNAILGNAFRANGALAVDLGSDGVTGNDPGDADTGPNERQNFPVITSASGSGGATTVQGTLNSLPNTTFRLEFFSSAACDASGNGEGETLLGSTTVTTDGDGNAAFSVGVGPAVVVTATATDPLNNTSEFSSCVTVTSGPGGGGVGRAYVAHSTTPGAVSVIDTSTNTVVGITTVGNSANDVALSPDRTRLYVSSFSSHTVSVIDTATNAIVGTITGTSFPLGIAVNAAGTRAYVASSGSRVYVVDLATNAVIASTAVTGSPNGIVINPAGTRVYVANRSSNQIAVIDTATNTVLAAVTTGTFPVNLAIAPDGGRVYVSNSTSNDVAVIDTATNAVVATVPVGSGPSGIGVKPDGTEVYVSNSSSNTISRISTATNAVVGSIPFAGGPYKMAFAGGFAYVVAAGGAGVRVIDLATNTIVATAPTTTAVPSGVAVGLVQASPGSADLSVTVVDSPDPVVLGGQYTHTINISNNGPSAASNVVVTDSIPAGATLVSVSGAGGCTSGGGLVTCAIGGAPSGSLSTIFVTLQANSGTSLTSTVRVTAAESDPQIANNVATVSTAANMGPTVFTVTNTNDSGAGSLRQAILSANGNIGAFDTIVFDLPGAGPYTIAPASPLPTITDAVAIDGTTQPGFSGTPLVELNGSGAGGSANGLVITAGASLVRSLCINRFGTGGAPGSGGGGGIVLQSAGNSIEGNVIGADCSGTTALPNRQDGVVVSGAGNTIGGSTAAARNVISGNGRNGIVFATGAAGNLVLGNYIGTSADGTAALGNGADGVIIGNASGNTIGGTGPGSGNVIAGNTTSGVQVFALAGQTASNNVIQGNFIGTNPALATALANGFDGVVIVAEPGGTATGNAIGGTAPDAGNVIAHNELVGVTIRQAGATGNPILANSIFGNGSIGIDNNAASDPDDVTPNDLGDADTGGNGLQNFPVITSAVTTGSTTTVEGTLNSTPNTTFRLEFFSSAACDPSNHGEGETFIGSTNVTTDGTGDATFSVSVGTAVVVTATATDPSNNTSEFSACVTATTGTPLIDLALVDTPLLGLGRTAALQIMLPAPAPTGGVVVTVTSDNGDIVFVAPPGTATIAEGQTAGQVMLSGVGSGTTTVRANAAGYSEGTLAVTVTPNVLTVPATLNVPFAQTASLPITIPQAAPAGGIVVSLASADQGIIEVVTPTVTIPQGAVSANGTVRGVTPGTAAVTASSPSFASAVSQVSSTGALNILETSATFPPGFPVSITVRLETALGSPVAAPPGGVTVNLAAANPLCLAVPETATIPAGLVSVSVQLTYGGTAALPCNTTLAVSASGLTGDTVPVTVSPAPGITMQGLPVSVGAGLQTNANPFCCGLAAVLGISQHGGVSVRIESGNPAVALVSPDATTPGAAFIVVNVPNGQSAVPYYVQGVEGTTGAVTITASADGFGDGSGTATVVQPVLRMNIFPTTTTAASPNIEFQVIVGVPDATNSFLLFTMPVRAGQTLTATATSSNPAAGLLFTQANGSGQSRQIDITAGNTTSPFGVASGGIAFDPVAAGTTTLNATIPGFLPIASSSVTMTVNPASVTMQGLPLTVGAGLQTNFNPFCCLLAVELSGPAPEPAGVTVRIESSNPAVALVSPDDTTAGAAFIDVLVPAGSSLAYYYVQGLEGAGGTATITATVPGFGEGSGTATVVQPAVQILGLPTATTASSADSEFQVYVGLSEPGNAYLTSFMPVRAGQTLTATVASSNAAVGRLVKQGEDPGASQQVTIAAGTYVSPFTVATGGVAFDPLSNGTTTVSVSIPGFITTTAGSVAVTVDPAGITMQGLPVTVGAGLQTNFNPFCCPLTVQLSGPAPAGGLTVHLESSNPAVALVSPDGLTEGTSSIDIDIDEGQTQAFYYVHGLEGASGAVTITATVPGFGEGSGTVTVAQPALMLVGLPTNTTPLSGNTEFQVAVGLPDATNAFLFTVMPVRAGRTLTTTVTTSNTDVGLLVTEADGAGQSRQVTIEENTYFTAGTVDTGGVAFDPVGGGTTTVTASIPGFITTTAGAVAVSVGTPGITMQGLPVTVGAGLQTNVNPFCCALAVVLGASEHGPIDVTIQSSNPSVALVSADANDPGTAFIQIEVPNGQTVVPYHVHGVEGATGTVTITAAAPGFSDGSGTATVAPAALQIVNLPAGTTTTSGDTEFEVFVGLPDATNSFLATTMPVRVGASLTATVTSSNSDVGALVKQGSPIASSQQVSIAAGSYFTPFGVASGGVAFRPVGPGTTLVSAAIPGVLTTTAGAVTMEVTSGAGGGGLRGTKKKK